MREELIESLLLLYLHRTYLVGRDRSLANGNAKLVADARQIDNPDVDGSVPSYARDCGRGCLGMFAVPRRNKRPIRSTSRLS